MSAGRWRGARRLRVTAGVAVAIGALALVARGITLDQDPIRALSDPDPVRARLFKDYQQKNPLDGKVFVEAPADAPEAGARAAALLRDAGYREVALFQPPSPAKLVELAPLLPPGEVEALLGDDGVRQRAASIAELAGLPGTGGLLDAMAADPLGLAAPVLARLFPGASEAPGATPVRVFVRDGPLDFDRVGALLRGLEASPAKLHYIGGDLFAYENFRAVQHDLVVNSVLSVILNLVIFYGFTGRWALLGLLFFGSLVSYLTGLVSTWAFYAEIQAVVLAYTSTFVGFNNEALVHLAGIEEHRKRTTLLGIWSAIGTTVIGFLVLLAGRSVIVRQMALASLGGMAGFLAFLYPYRATMNAVRFRAIAVRPLTIRPRTLVLGCVAALAAIAAVGVPRFATRIDDFRYETPQLTAAIAHYQERLDQLSLEDVVAVPAPAGGEPGAALAPLAEQGVVDLAHHPLRAWRPVAEQEETVSLLRARLPAARALLDRELDAAGIRLPGSSLEAPRALGAWEFLGRLGDLGAVRWSDEVGGRRFVMASVRHGFTGRLPAEVAPVTPRRYYNGLLTDLSSELAWLFLAGLAAMAVYLAWLQRSALRTLYVFSPLALASLAFVIWARAGGFPVNIIHVMGFSLVIALAMDYTAVAVSSDHAPEETSKVLLTGLSTLATFGALALAHHPVLRALGVTVVLGCGVSLALALLVRVAPGAGRAP